MRITVLPDEPAVGRPATGAPDAAINELAILLHSHLIGELTVHPGGDAEAWRTFLLLLGENAGLGPFGRRHRARLGDDGGPARRAARDRLRRSAARATRGEAAGLDKVIANCLQGSAFDLDEEAFANCSALPRTASGWRADGGPRGAAAIGRAASARKPRR
jgi:hypothetical protein